MQVEVKVEDSLVHKRDDFQVHKRDDSQVHKRVPCLLSMMGSNMGQFQYLSEPAPED